MSHLATGLRWVVWALHAVAGITLLLIMVVTVVDITGRYFFGRPVAGTVELTQFGMVVVVFLGLAWTERERGHITVDLLYERLPRIMRRVVGVLAYLIGITAVVVGFWKLLAFRAQMQRGGYATPVLDLDIHPLVLAAALGMLFYALAMVVNLVSSFTEEAGEVHDPDAPEEVA